MHLPRTFRGAITLIFAVCLVLLFADFAWFLLVPNVSRLKTSCPTETSFMRYRERCWKAEGRTVVIRRQWVPYGRISPFVVRAVIIGEDAKFWRHHGFDYAAIENAIRKDIEVRKFVLGGSTISQQLAKNLFLSPWRNPLRKINEAILTWRIERTLSKRRIIELYLNVVEWGDGIFGIEAAARHYYGCPAAQLGAYEAARLASVLPNPVRFRPTSGMRYVARRSRLIYAVLTHRHQQTIETIPATLPPDTTVQAHSDTGAAAKAPEADTIPEQDVNALLDSLAK